MQNNYSDSSNDTLSNTTTNQQEPWKSPFENIPTGCCYSIGSNEDYDDFYRPVQKNYYPFENDEPIDDELGLIEDHFSRPEGFFGLSTKEELEMAIKNCKEMILQIPEKTPKKRQLVEKLVQLRLKYQETEENPETPPEFNIVLGHNFELANGDKLQNYCEKCCNLIWGVFNKWYKCKNCGYKCHNKCLNLVTRICAHTKVQENPSYILDICPEVHLFEQKYRCADCKRKFVFKKEGECLPRLCDYTGFYYCHFCHWNSSAIIPARVIHNWDFEKRKVCRASAQFLRIMRKKPVFDLESLNKSLFVYVSELNIIKKFRHDLLVMKQYFLACHAASKEKLLLQLKDRQHFVENENIYSLTDLIDAQSGQLFTYLQNVYSVFIEHITEKCQGCRGKGFICELCNAEEVLFPFYNQVDTCTKCNSLFHQECFVNRNGHCPKCARKTKQSELES